MLNGFDSSLVSGFQAQASWKAELGHTSASSIGLLNAAYYLAAFAMAPFAWYVSENYGCRWCIRYSAFANILGTVIGAAAGTGNTSGYGMFMALRIIVGSGIGFCLMISPIMLQECSHPRQRTFMAGLFNCVFSIGGFTAAWVIFGCSHIKNSNWSWRIPYILHLGPALFMAIVIWSLPESPRWLKSKGRDAEALDFLVKFHGNGNQNDPLVELTFREVKEALESERVHKQASLS